MFGEIVNGLMVMNDAGQMVAEAWKDLPSRFPLIQLDQFMIMPNHLHGIVIIDLDRGNMGDHKDRPYDIRKDICHRGESCIHPRGTKANSIGRIVQAFKSITTHRYANGVKTHTWHPFPGRLWQRNYYEHVIRAEGEFNEIREYIVNNPLQWELDRENPSAKRVEDKKPWEP